MTVFVPNVKEKYNLGPVKSWVRDAAYFLGPRHGIKVIGGWRSTDEFPDHPSGHAIDLMIPNLSVGTSLAQDAINNHVQLGITGKSYIIFNRRVWNDHQGWHPYTSTSNPHTDHVHITMWNAGTGVPGGAIPTDDDPAGGPISATQVSTVDATCAWKIHFPVAGDSCLATHVQLRQGLSVILTGASVVIGLVGVVLLAAYALGKSDTVKQVARVAMVVK